MKRPFAMLGYLLIASFSVALFCFNYQINPFFSLVIIIPISIIIAKRSKKFIIYPLMTFVFVIYSFVAVANYHKLSFESGDYVSVLGSITEREISFDNSSYNYTIEIDSIDGEPVSSNLYVSFEFCNIWAEVYDKVIFNGEVVSSDIGYAYQNDLYMLANGLAFTAEFESGEVIRVANEFVSAILNYKENLKTQFIEEFEDGGAISYGVLTGDRSLIEDDDYYSYLGSGVLHIFAVSGLHVAIVAAIFLFLFKIFILNYKVRYILAMVSTTVFYFVFCFGSMSATRAIIMAYLLFLAQIFAYKTDLENSLGVAAVIILILNPKAAVDLSFLLSYFSVLGIVKVMPVLRSYLKTENIIIRSILLTVSVSFATIIPLSLMNGRVYPAAIVANLIIIPLLTVLLTALLISSFLIFFAIPLPDIILLVVKFITDIISLVTEFLADFRSSALVSDIYLILFVLASIILYKLIYKKENRFIYANAIGILIVVTGITSALFPTGIKDGIYLYRNYNDYAVVAIVDREVSVYIIGNYLSTERVVSRVIDENGYTDITLYLRSGKESRLLLNAYDIDVLYIDEGFVTFDFQGRRCIISYDSKPNFNSYFLAVNSSDVRADIILDNEESQNPETISLIDSRDVFLIEPNDYFPQRIYDYEE